MQGRQFLEVARELLPGTLPRHRRVAVVTAYYSLLLECRDLLVRWGITATSIHQVHSQVRLKLVYSSDVDLKDIGYKVESLAFQRNQANYDLTDRSIYDSPAHAQQCVQIAGDRLALLDAIDADPARRAAAIAALPP